MDQLDPVYVALVMFRRREFDSCIDVCTAILDRNPYDEAVWSLKTRSLTAQVLQNVPAWLQNLNKADWYIRPNPEDRINKKLEDRINDHMTE